MAKRRTAADQERIREEVKAAMAEPRGEPIFPQPSRMAASSAPLSSCCGAAVRINRACVKCGQSCEAVSVLS